MGSAGRLEVDVEVKSSPEKFWEVIRDSTTIFPKAFSHDYKSIEVLEGDGKSVGSVRFITYSEGSPLVKVSTEKITVVDESIKAVSYCVIDGDLLKYYKVFIGHITVNPKDGGSSVKWVCEYEKAHEEIPNPDVIKDFVVKNFQEVDAYILGA